MSELAGKLVTIKTSGNPISLAEAALERTSDTVWQIKTEAFRLVDINTTPILEMKDGEADWVDISYKSIDWWTGTFTFSGDGYTADKLLRVRVGHYLTLSTAAYAHNYSYSRGVELHDIPTFLSDYKKRLPGQKFASGSLSQWDMTDSYYETALTAGKPVVFEFRATESGDPRRVWALLESQEMSAAIGSAQDMAVSFISTGKLLNL